jgi:hypothetical protein
LAWPCRHSASQFVKVFPALGQGRVNRAKISLTLA